MPVGQQVPYAVPRVPLTNVVDRLTVIPPGKRVSTVTIIGLPNGGQCSLHLGTQSDGVPLLAQGLQIKCCPPVETGIAVTVPTAQGGELVLLVTFGDATFDITGGGLPPGIVAGAVFVGNVQGQNGGANAGCRCQLANPATVGGKPNTKLLTVLYADYYNNIVDQLAGFTMEADADPTDATTAALIAGTPAIFMRKTAAMDQRFTGTPVAKFRLTQNIPTPAAGFGFVGQLGGLLSGNVGPTFKRATAPLYPNLPLIINPGQGYSFISATNGNPAIGMNVIWGEG